MAQQLQDIKGVGPSTEEQLEDAGIDNLNDLAQCPAEKLVDETSFSEGKANRLIKLAKQDAVLIQTGDEVAKEHEKKERISTGIPALDDVLGGGWEEGFITLVQGDPGSGKTQIAFQSCVQAVEETKDQAIYIETEEGRYRPDRLKNLSNEDDTQEKINKAAPRSLDQQMLTFQKLQKDFSDISIVVVDSFNALFRREYDGRGEFAERSRQMTDQMAEIEKTAKVLECPILLTGQVYGNPTPRGKSGRVYGGSVMKHSAGSIVEMSQSSGELVEAELMKHPGLGRDSAEIRITDTDLQGA